jgi:adenylate cyclase
LLKNYTEAERYFLKSFSTSKEIANLNTLRSSAEGLSNTFLIKKQFEKAYYYYKESVTARDSMVNTENTKKIVRMEMQYGFDKKQNEVKLIQEKKDLIAKNSLNRQKMFRNSFLAGIILLVAFSLLVMRQRNKVLKEKKRSDSLLLNILPAEVAEELKAKGETEAKLFDEVTVLFTDFLGFTELSEKLSPKELIKDLHECFTAFDNIIQKHNLEKIKTSGDAYMAAGGLPTPNNTHAMDAVNAALEIRRFLEEGKEKRIANGQHYFELRIGVHSGPVIAGIIGVKKFSYDIWGDTVNTAARMESSGEAGKVNISGATYELVKETFSCTYRGKIQAKGKGDVDMYFAEGAV